MSNDAHPPCERLTVVEVNPSHPKKRSMLSLGRRIFRETLNDWPGHPVDSVIVVYQSELRAMTIEEFSIIQQAIQIGCYVLEIKCNSSILFCRGGGPSFQIVIDRWYPVTISFYDKRRFDQRATRGLTNYSMIQVHVGPDEKGKR
jgi:hypothetical protein